MHHRSWVRWIIYKECQILSCHQTTMAFGAVNITVVVVTGLVAVAIIFPTSSTSNYAKEKFCNQEHFEHAAVAANTAECSSIGRDILLKGGNAADATVAAFICSGLFSSQNSGIGGGVFIVYYDYKRGEKVFINGRGKAPLGTAENMYSGKPLAAQDGGLSIVVPGEVSAMWELHKTYGRLPWTELFQPSIRLAQEGFVIPVALGSIISSEKENILNDPHLREVFLKEDGSLYVAGDTMTRPKLATTLQQIAEGGKDVFYKGQLADNIILDIAEYDGILNKTDLETYTVDVTEPVHFVLDDWDVYASNAPGGGPPLALILNILEGYKLTPDSFSNKEKSALTYHRMIESFKFGFAKKTALGDRNFVNEIEDIIAEMTSQEYADSLRERISDDITHTFEYYKPVSLNKEDSGTNHISIIDEEGNACSATSSINLHFGSKTMGNRTGIIFNDIMDDFSQPGEENFFNLPPSSTNFLAPGKIPLSSKTPAICIDSNGKVMQVLGASGGTRIITSVAATIMFNKWLGDDLRTAIERPRLHDQLLPQEIFYEPGFSQEIIDLLKMKGHNISDDTPVFSGVVQGISRLKNDWLEAHCDSREGSSPAGY